MLLSLQIRLVLLVFVFLVNLILVIFVYKYNKNIIVSRLFMIFSIAMQLWLISVSIALIPKFYKVIFLPRLSMGAAVGLDLLPLLIVSAISGWRYVSRKFIIAMIVCAIFLFPLTLSPYIFKSINNGNPTLGVEIGWAMPLFGLFSFLSLGACIVVFYRAIRRAKLMVERKQLWLLLFGFVGMNACFIFTIMLPIIIFQNAVMVQFGGLYILFFLICTAIAIVKYHLFNIRIIATEFLVLIFNSILFIQLAASNSIKRGVLNGLLLVLCGALSYLLLKYARRELKEGQEKVRFEALEESNRRLQALDKQKTEFLNIAAHQLRTPTSVVNNYLAMIKDGDYGVVGAELKPVMDNIEASNQWLIKLADKLLYLSKIEQGDIKYHFEACDIVSLIKKIIAEFIPLADEKGLKIVFSDNGGEALNVSIDEEKIKLAVFNLLDNAVRYSEAGIIKVETMDEKREEKSGVTVRVIDQGIGFASEDKEKFFHKFQRGVNASATNVHTSTGLGLYLVRKFVEGHNGYVWAKSEGLNMGSEFGVWLPVKK